MRRSAENSRRTLASVNQFGTTQLHHRHPLIIAWWSAAFPGFGHLLLSKYIRGGLLIGWEVVLNTAANINLSMIYTFTGQFDLVINSLEIGWMLLYLPFYLFGIYDSYRLAIDLNQAYTLAIRENAPFSIFYISTWEVNVLDKRAPWLAIVWSLFLPGMGQLYANRLPTAFFLLFGWLGITYQSHLLEAIPYMLLADFFRASSVVNPEWLLFLPSIYFFSAYDAYVNAIEHNKLFDREQRSFLQHNYQSKDFPMPLK